MSDDRPLEKLVQINTIVHGDELRMFGLTDGGNVLELDMTMFRQMNIPAPAPAEPMPDNAMITNDGDIVDASDVVETEAEPTDNGDTTAG